MMAEYEPSRDEGDWWLTAVGLVGVAMMVAGPAISWKTWQQLSVARSSSTWPQAEMTVTQGSVVTKRVRRGTTYRADIRYAFEVNGVAYMGKRIWFQYGGTPDPAEAEDVLQQYQVGSTHRGYYKPDDPNESVLHNEVGPLSYFFPLVGVALFLAGIPIARENLKHIRDKRERSPRPRRGGRRQRNRSQSETPPKRSTRTEGKPLPGRDEKGRLRRRKWNE
jgi:hypothetical protein